ncbi:FAD-binding oxidoreductase [Pelagibius sp. Alg239-R121]|uniref:FAD-binding oxidoreductase n=1 Tax=Pelagibius sp. Alg239-R121 TaxID=2993448 RepID=UPI0024A678DF|nr:FAD-binding oxidoreductase [Pelagibius sp. Alg239-R121]
MNTEVPQPHTDSRLADFFTELENAVGPKAVLTASEDLAPHLQEMRGLYLGDAPCVIKPGSTEEVATVVKICARHGMAVVPQGGNTGLVGGGIPITSDKAIVLSLSRMNTVREIDTANYTMTVEAGCILQNIQMAADKADRLFPLSLGAEGTCQIGGNLSTNAGGINVLRYGNARDLVLGLEVVLPDGQIWHGLRALRKDNTGYDLKHLFVGGEGTLGIITAAVLKLFAKPRDRVTAFAAVPTPAAAVELLGRCRTISGEAVSSFELIPRIGLANSIKHVAGVTDPLDQAYDWYVLVDLVAGIEDGSLSETMMTVLEGALEEELILDATVAASETQAAALWRIREAMVEAQKHEGGSIKHDVSVPISSVPDFLERAIAAVSERIPGIRPVPFGHIGDGNIHFNLSQPVGADRANFLARWDEMNEVVHDIVVSLGGSISAEHGIGRLKVQSNAHYKSAVEIELMKKIKAALDPEGLMNPHKVVD